MGARRVFAARLMTWNISTEVIHLGNQLQFWRHHRHWLRVTLLDGLLHNPKATAVGQEHQFQMSIELRLLRRVSTRFSPGQDPGKLRCLQCLGHTRGSVSTPSGNSEFSISSRGIKMIREHGTEPLAANWASPLVGKDRSIGPFLLLIRERKKLPVDDENHEKDGPEQ
ncbi:predicted protein [Histoplasma capsulatum H143]|uniref:Uncharacterized protein n=1 Tax=Ajellomyces capsulatus (strain H143) TaxID=544712 RepID=C6H9U5_AJECH|nr:predicted protein [Histoplasma capsulatum H143]